MNVIISADKMAATIKLIRPKDPEPVFTEKDVLKALSSSGVVHGIKNDVISFLMRGDHYDETFEIARGTLPTAGENASVELNFVPVRELKPRERADGTVDYRDIGYVQNTKKGDVLAIKHPAVLGEPGLNVLGKEIPAPKLPDVKLPQGKGTEISADGLNLVASVDGQVSMSGRSVTVMNTLTLDTVDMSTGNIDFVGNVQVNGDVAQGAVVKAVGDVIIKGSLDGGTIITDGNVIINNGYNGRGSGEIRAKGSVKCKYIQNGTVTAGDIEVGASISALLRSKSTVKITGKTALVLASHIMARSSIECVNVGSETSSGENTLEVGNDPELIQRSQAIPQEIKTITAQLAQLERLESVFAQLEAAGRLREDQEEKRAQVKLSRDKSNADLIDLSNEQDEVAEALQTTGYGTIIVTGTLHPFATICIGPERIRVENETQFVRFTRRQDGISTSPAR
jgi:uncharacterized protein (DUF342 family)